MSFTLLTISMPRPGPPSQRRQQLGQRLARAFHARRHDARGDHRRLQQPQIIAREIEHFGKRRDLRDAPRSTLASRSTGSSITRK